MYINKENYDRINIVFILIHVGQVKQIYGE